MSHAKSLGTVAIGVLSLWLLALVISYLAFPDWTVRGQFGDSFGALNSLFSGLAFGSLIVTIYLQSNELALQREELKLQREEMAASRQELANQAAVQRALFLATVAQVRVSAAQAEVEAIRMESEAFTPGGRDRHAQQIRAVANRVAEIANEVIRAADVG